MRVYVRTNGTCRFPCMSHTAERYWSTIHLIFTVSGRPAGYHVRRAFLLIILASGTASYALDILSVITIFPLDYISIGLALADDSSALSGRSVNPKNRSEFHLLPPSFSFVTQSTPFRGISTNLSHIFKQTCDTNYPI